MNTPLSNNRLIAVSAILTAVAVTAGQDAIMKSASASYPAYEAVIFRGAGALPLVAASLFHWGLLKKNDLIPTHWPLLLLRCLILCAGYFCFILAIAALPLANAIAIYFTLPFFVAALAGPLFGERVYLYRWCAIIAGFVGVLIMNKPLYDGHLEPAAFLALFSAFAYAIGQMMGRPLAHHIHPLIINAWQNIAYMAMALILAVIFSSYDFSGATSKSIIFLSRPWVTPSWNDAMLMICNGVLGFFGMLLFISAYKHAESSYVAFFEYSFMIWAVLYGIFLFNDYPNQATWFGIILVIAANIFMIWRDRRHLA